MRIAILLGMLVAGGTAADPERFRFVPKQPTWQTASLDIRDGLDLLWPTLIGGRNQSGEVLLTDQGMSGAFTIRCQEFNQIDGDQSRRVLGDLVARKPVVELVVTAIRTPAVARTAEDELGIPTSNPNTPVAVPARARLTGTFVLADKRLPVEMEVSVRRVSMRQVSMRLDLNGSFVAKGADLGLRSATVAVIVYASGYRHPDDLKGLSIQDQGSGLEAEIGH